MKWEGNNIDVAKNINILERFVGKGILPLLEKYGIEQADVMVLFGGSIIAGGDVIEYVIIIFII